MGAGYHSDRQTFGDYYDGRTAGVDWHVPIQRFADGKATFMVYHSAAIAYEQLPDMEDDFGFIPFPKGPSAPAIITVR